jgi:hypothetical protein
MPSADSCEPERPFRVVFGRRVRSAARLPSRPVASARIQRLGELAGRFLERTAQLPRHKVSAKEYLSGLCDDVNTSRSLAYCELYLTFAYIFRRFDVREDPIK